MEMMWMTMDQISREAELNTPVVVPFGSTEEHGSHLPLATDTLQAQAVANKAAQLAHALVAPPVHYGICSSTRNHPGTVTLSGDTFRSVARDIIRSLVQQGFKNLILFSGHAGRVHMSSLREAAQDCVCDDPELQIAVVSDFDLVARSSEDLIDTKIDSHAGEIETSRMLHLFPDSVKGRSPAELPSLPPFRVVPDPEKYWPGGVWGDPEAADENKGRLMVERAAAELSAIIRSFSEAEV